MLIKLIIFLVRIKLGLKKYVCFQFSNQKSNAVYFFTSTGIKKYWNGVMVESGISLNWLLDPECERMLIRRNDLIVDGDFIYLQSNNGREFY